MANSLDSLMNNLVGVSGMVCENCGGSCEITRIDKDYVAHEKCRNYYLGYGKHQLTLHSILNNFYNLRDGHTDEKFRLLLRKGVYRYEYMSSWDKFEETKLSPKEAFHSNLSMSDISDRDYEHAQKVWKVFGMKNLGE